MRSATASVFFYTQVVLLDLESLWQKFSLYMCDAT